MDINLGGRHVSSWSGPHVCMWGCQMSEELGTGTCESEVLCVLQKEILSGPSYHWLRHFTSLSLSPDSLSVSPPSRIPPKPIPSTCMPRLLDISCSLIFFPFLSLSFQSLDLTVNKCYENLECSHQLHILSPLVLWFLISLCCQLQFQLFLLLTDTALVKTREG